MRVGWLTTAIFVDLSGYLFGNFKDKASNIIWRYDTLCWPVTDCKMNDQDDLERLFHIKLGFRPRILDSEGSTLKHNYVKTDERRPTLSAQKYSSITHSFWQYKSFVDIRRRCLLGRLRT